METEDTPFLHAVFFHERFLNLNGPTFYNSNPLGGEALQQSHEMLSIKIGTQNHKGIEESTASYAKSVSIFNSNTKANHLRNLLFFSTSSRLGDLIFP